MRSIVTSGGVAIFVDEDDYMELSSYMWHVRKGKQTQYAVTGNNVRMHRVILNAKKGQIVDHINGNGLDNRRQNLRFVTDSQNCQNRRNQAGKDLPKGVIKVSEGRYRSRIRVKGKLLHLGYYPTEDAAAKAYDEAALQFFGQYAKLNNKQESNK